MGSPRHRAWTSVQYLEKCVRVTIPLSVREHSRHVEPVMKGQIVKRYGIAAVCLLYFVLFLPSMAPGAGISREDSTTGGEMQWLVIFGSYQSGDRVGAEKRLSLVILAGGDARIERTDYFPNLTPNLLIVVAGPYTKEAARQTADRLSETLPERPYIKSFR